jgi:hypothetical protein
MSASRMRLMALGLTATGLVAAASLTGLGQPIGHLVRDSLRLNAAEPAAPVGKDGGAPVAPRQEKSADAADGKGGDVRIEAPGTHVSVDKERGKVSVTAPHTEVRVDPDQGRVQVRAPYVNLDIRW